MISRILQLATFGIVLSAASCAFTFAHFGLYTLATVGASLILFFYALVLAVEFALLAIVGRRGGDPHGCASPTAVEMMRAWIGEVAGTPIVFCWQQPFRSTAEPDLLEVRGSAARGVVLVHGFLCNRGFWNPWMRKLRGSGIPYVAVTINGPFSSISDGAAAIESGVRRLEAATGQRPVIVAHSMGGLAVRWWLAERSAGCRVHRVITIGSPHRGTWLARFSHTTNGKQMRLSSSWIADLVARETTSTYAMFTCFFGSCDNVVFPTWTAVLPGAECRSVPATAHVQMAYHPAVLQEVLHWVRLDPISGDLAAMQRN